MFGVQVFDFIVSGAFRPRISSSSRPKRDAWFSEPPAVKAKNNPHKRHRTRGSGDALRQGKRYFTCNDKHGIFCKATFLQPEEARPRPRGHVTRARVSAAVGGTSGNREASWRMLGASEENDQAGHGPVLLLFLGRFAIARWKRRSRGKGSPAWPAPKGRKRRRRPPYGVGSVEGGSLALRVKCSAHVVGAPACSEGLKITLGTRLKSCASIPVIGAPCPNPRT